MSPDPNDPQRTSFIDIIRDQNLSIKNIYTGEVDTTIELATGGSDSGKDFFNSYYVRNENELDEFLKGKRYFVYGQKGVGKTAFLRYAIEKLKRDHSLKRKSDLFLFSQDFPKQIHSEITEYIMREKNLANTPLEPDNVFRDIDYENFWIFAILSRLDNYLSTDGKSMVVANDDFKSFHSIINSMNYDTIFDRFARLIPKVKGGSASISKDPSIKFDFEFDGKSSDYDKFDSFVKLLISKFKLIEFSEGYTYNLVFDEIDPRVGSGKAFDLDCILIRDLIIAIYRLNISVPVERRRVVFNAAIRSEILRIVNKLGKEVHKLIEQLGINMSWGEFGRLDISHPLIKMTCKKIMHSEKKFGLFDPRDEENYRKIWDKYFIKNKNNPLNPYELLRITWMKPRDIVRILGVCKSIDGDSRYFSSSLIDRSKTKYYNNSWEEILSQLSASFGSNTVRSIEFILSEYKDVFNLHDLKKRIEKISLNHGTVKQLHGSKNIGDIIEILYFNGVVGTVVSNKDHQYYYMGQTTFDLNSDFVLHPSVAGKFRVARVPDGPNQNSVAIRDLFE